MCVALTAVKDPRPEVRSHRSSLIKARLPVAFILSRKKNSDQKKLLAIPTSSVDVPLSALSDDFRRFMRHRPIFLFRTPVIYPALRL